MTGFIIFKARKGSFLTFKKNLRKKQKSEKCSLNQKIQKTQISFLTTYPFGALLGVNAFAFTYPTHVIPGNQNQPFDVKTKLRWTLAGEYENCISATTQ